jgi:hypothetical protein
MLTLADIIDPKITKQLETIRQRWNKSLYVPDSTKPCKRRKTEVMVFGGSIQQLNQLMCDIAFLLQLIRRLQKLAKEDLKS